VQSTAIVPAGWDPEAYGAGIVSALGLLQANPAAGLGIEAAAPSLASTDTRVAVTELLDRVYGKGGVEAAGPVLADRQFAPELACLAFDRLRAQRTRRAHLESLPPQALSPSLRRRLQEKARTLAVVEAG
jgi:hypothetical protein